MFGPFHNMKIGRRPPPFHKRKKGPPPPPPPPLFFPSFPLAHRGKELSPLQRLESRVFLLKERFLFLPPPFPRGTAFFFFINGTLFLGGRLLFPSPPLDVPKRKVFFPPPPLLLKATLFDPRWILCELFFPSDRFRGLP